MCSTSSSSFFSVTNVTFLVGLILFLLLPPLAVGQQLAMNHYWSKPYLTRFIDRSIELASFILLLMLLLLKRS